jgi:RHS repeat-associated protein
VSYTYDDYDRLTGMQDSIGTWGFGYNLNSDLTSVDGPWNNDTLTYGYDDLGRRTSLTPQGGTALSYVYDRLNRLTTIQAGSANHVYAYTGVNPLVQSLTRPNGSTTSYQYNGENQLTEILNKTSTDDMLNQHVFTYNTLDLRGSETISGFALPAMPALPEETVDYAYNAVNQLLSVTNPNLTFVYDDDGNMTQGYINPLLGGAGVGFPFTATYDAEDRMTSLEYTDSSSVVHRTEYRYSGDGFLAEIRKYENSALVDTVRIVRDGLLAVQDRDGSNNVLREYTWGLNLGGGIGGLLNLKQGGQDYAYLYDGNGNVAAVLDGSQAVVAAYRYAPFGKLLAQTGSLTQPFGFSTKRYDAQTGLIYYGFRFYGPEIGRWTTRDPLGEAGGMNLYAFVGNNPVNWVDPYGLINWKKLHHTSFVINLTSETVLVSGNDPDSGKQLQWVMPAYSISLFLDTPFENNDIDAVYYGDQTIKLWGPPGAWFHLPKRLRPKDYDSFMGDLLRLGGLFNPLVDPEKEFGGLIPLPDENEKEPCK